MSKVQTYTVRLLEARTTGEATRSKVSADRLDNFGVQATTPDGAKAAARAWLKERGHRIRSVNHSADADDVGKRVLLVYVSAGSSAAARALAKAKAKAKKP